MYFRYEGVEEWDNALLLKQVTKVVISEQERGINLIIGGNIIEHILGMDGVDCSE